jgi:hypothetical protein
MKLGFYYQAGHVDNNILATYTALKQLRKIYPNAPVAFFEDNSTNLKPIAEIFNCDYTKIVVEPEYINKRMLIVDLKTGLQFLKHVYDACITTLKDCEWVMNFEDDVWIQNEIKSFPLLDFGGNPGHGYQPQMYEYLKNRFNVTDNSRTYGSPLGQLEGYGMCGGGVFKREAFLEAYSKIDEIDWEYLRTLDQRISMYGDAILSFVMLHAGFRYQPWDQFTQYHPGIQYSPRPVVHAVKYFYDYKTIEDLSSVVEKEEVKQFLIDYNGL